MRMGTLLVPQSYLKLQLAWIAIRYIFLKCLCVDAVIINLNEEEVNQRILTDTHLVLSRRRFLDLFFSVCRYCYQSLSLSLMFFCFVDLFSVTV